MSLRERRATDTRRLRARSLATGRSGLVCHCEKGELPTLAAHVHGALPLVGAAWGVTARKASHNASNARDVAAGKMGCNSMVITHVK